VDRSAWELPLPVCVRFIDGAEYEADQEQSAGADAGCIRGAQLVLPGMVAEPDAWLKGTGVAEAMDSGRVASSTPESANQHARSETNAAPLSQLAQTLNEWVPSDKRFRSWSAGARALR